MKKVIVGYSGHSYVVLESAASNNFNFTHYCDVEEKFTNPYNLYYLGKENFNILSNAKWFVGIGENVVRKNIIEKYSNHGQLTNCIHSSSIIAQNVIIGKGVFISAGTIINPLSEINNGTIINTGSIVEHECVIHDYAHIGPGAVLAGNVRIGQCSFVGANSVIKEGISVGDQVIIGAGSVIINDVPDNCIVVGNPGRVIKIKN